MATSPTLDSISEVEALLPHDIQDSDNTQPPLARNRASGRWIANPYWVIPVVLVANISRGMTVSPRIQVFNEIACRVLSASSPGDISPTMLLPDTCQTPEVQARASRIQASIVITMSVLSSASTGLWSQWGDIKGRKLLFIVSIVGFIAMELVFILVSAPSINQRGELFILIGPVFEGLCGGYSVFNAVFHAYISDCTPDGSRSKIFSSVQGIVFVGRALGPWIAGIVLSNSTLGSHSLFYISVSIQLVLLVYVLFFVPESLRSRERQRPEVDVELEPRPTTMRAIEDKQSIKQIIRRFMVVFVSPITMFRPRVVEDGVSRRKDYSLTLLGSAMFLYIVSTAVYQLKFLYGQHTYDWTTVQLGYYMSFLWISRAINLLILLPILISYLKPKTPIVVLSAPEAIAREIQFDKCLARASLTVDAMGDLLIVATPASSQVAFIGASCLSAFTSGGNPALHSLGAVCLHALGHSSETGRLFGAVGVLDAIAHIMAPAFFAAIYGMTVGSYPKTIFVFAATFLLSSVLLLGGIRRKGVQ
ncbi:major facilitator superfamily domain-containing protein [Favolaschia claudopus]|uniref:Major facilitator superfamily domain-containing protein n=1 Tax=Favolaschia claudopus TaxID=2862362 RepID=A0AAW0D2W6_9AGAR